MGLTYQHDRVLVSETQVEVELEGVILWSAEADQIRAKRTTASTFINLLFAGITLPGFGLKIFSGA